MMTARTVTADYCRALSEFVLFLFPFGILKYSVSRPVALVLPTDIVML